MFMKLLKKIENEEDEDEEWWKEIQQNLGKKPKKPIRKKPQNFNKK